MEMALRSTIAITAGDPCGVGSEVILKALARPVVRAQARFIIIGDLAVFSKTAARLHRRLPSWHVMSQTNFSAESNAPLTFIDVAHGSPFRPGHSSRKAGKASLDYLNCAITLWRAQRLQALVTAPVTKWAIQRTRPSFVGQTEYLAKALHAREVVMMFVAEKLRVALLTRHVPLRDVARVVDRRLIRSTLSLTIQSLRHDFGIRRPRLAVCGLNPHAGEGGHLGHEEVLLLRPVMRELQRQRVACDGPFAADGFFAQPRKYDAIICWYHDQGLIPFKMVARDRGCQMSVGLPIIRTSPDHGSALDIAGRGIANPGSMIYALQLATKLAGYSC